MLRRTLNLGILAHVDAGKTSLTERLLFESGAIERLGSVDSGTTRTDSSALERERGITIRSAVAPFSVGDLQINIVDTPGHPDFIAEVERALSVLDAAVLVVSAVEGVQAQTRVLMRSLLGARIPTILFVNKIDRTGARTETLLPELNRKLSVQVFPTNSGVDVGGPEAKTINGLWTGGLPSAAALETLADLDDDILSVLVEDKQPSGEDIILSLKKLTLQTAVHPVFFGSALKGIGIEDLTTGIATLFAPAGLENTTVDELPAGTVFAIERNANGEKNAYIRLWSGELSDRQLVHLSQIDSAGAAVKLAGRIKNLQRVSLSGHDRDISTMRRGDIGKFGGIPEVRVGAQLGEADLSSRTRGFPPPTLEAVVSAINESDKNRLFAALMSLGDEDPLIRLRLANDGSVSLLLYGEVQKEVISERLHREFGVQAVFSKSSAIYLERPTGSGEHIHEIDPLRHNDFWATVGLRVEANPTGDGNIFQREVHWGLMPAGFYRAVEEAALQALEQGLCGWPVTDCRISLTRLGYDRPISTAADFRNVTPIVLMHALKKAGTKVYEPCHKLEIELPETAVGPVMAFLAVNEAEIGASEKSGDQQWTIFGKIPARNVQNVSLTLPALTQGEGVLFSHAEGDTPVHGLCPSRNRSDGNPLDYQEYMRFLSQRVA